MNSILPFRNQLIKLGKSPFVFPVALLFLCIAAYGLLIPQLGFYFDDWPVVLVIKEKLNFWEYYTYDRPFSAWTFVLTAPLFGLKPLYWHLFTLVLRWLTCLGMWGTLVQIWPQRKQEAMWITFLFAINPAFIQQPIAVAYSQHFITYAFFFLSVGTMLAALQSKRWFWPLMLVSLFSEGMHLFTMEYFWGLEFIRPFLIFLLPSNTQGAFKNRVMYALRNWTPFFILLLIAVVWRMFFVQLPIDDPNELEWLQLLREAPWQAIVQWFQSFVRDWMFLLFTSWGKSFQPNLVDFQIPSLTISWVITMLAGMGTYLYFRLTESSDESSSSWHRQVIFIGLVAMFVGMWPGWIVGRQITIGLYSDRLALPAMFGVSLILVGILEPLVPKRLYRILILSGVVGLSVGVHFRKANDYRWDWESQTRFFWQLSWRIPDLQENTAIFSDGAIFTYTGEYPTGSALNVLYNPQTGSFEQPYWFFELDSGFHRDMRPILNGWSIENGVRNLHYSGNGNDGISIFYEPEGQCLWVLSEKDLLNTDVPALTASALPASHLERILITTDKKNIPDTDVFGPEPPHTWCYFYQKADLARQQGHWEQIVALAQEAEQKGYDPDNPYEWAPFIEGYAFTENWEKASELTFLAFEKNAQVKTLFCSTWNSFISLTPQNEHRDEVISQVFDQLRCNKP